MQIPISRRGGGGGTDLNFTIVGGTTQPENPKENTIWVNTDQEITGWSISSSSPNNSIDGIVWITYNITGEKIFNALSDNVIALCPVLAKQRISGAWVSKTIKIYQNNTWAVFFENPLTNGVPTAVFLSGGSTKVSGTTNSETFHTFSSSRLSLNVDGASSHVFKTNKTFDLRGVNKISVDGYTALANSSGNSTTTTSAPLTVSLMDGSGVVASATYYPKSTSTSWDGNEYFKLTLDVSSKGSQLNNCYFRFGMSRNGNYRSITIFKNIIFE